MAERRLPLPEVQVPGHRLGRHINHDPRSLQFKVAKTDKPETVSWQRRLPVLDQGDLGRCVPTSAVGVLGTEPFYSRLHTDIAGKLGDPLAIEWYRLVTRDDPYAGQWEPDDTGSDGLSMAKLLHRLGIIPGYEHITSIEAAWNAIKKAPYITGLMWMSGMDSPDGEGIVRATGTVRGGHEFEIAGYDAARGLWECWQSWGLSYGKAGRFYIPDEDYQKLLGMDGDATAFTLPDAPPPTPTPLTDAQKILDAFPYANVDKWAAAKKLWWTKRDKTAVDAYTAWRKLAK